MNKTLYPIFIAISMCCGERAISQSSGIDFYNSSNSHTSYGFAKENFLIGTDAIIDNSYYQVVQFSDLPSRALHDRLISYGIELTEYLGNRKYVASIPLDFDSNLLPDFGIEHTSSILPNQKLEAALKTGDIPLWALNRNKVELILRFHRNLDPDIVRRECISQNIEVLSENRVNSFLKVSIDKSRIFEIANLPFVSFIETAPEPGRPDDNMGRAMHRSNVIDVPYPNGRQYNGSGVGLLCRDDGQVGPHIDFEGRINNNFIDNPNTGGGIHGDGVSGVMAGAGNLNPRLKGMASGADLFVLNYQADFLDETMQLHQEHGVLVTNSSYSNGCNGGYTNITATVDQQLFDFPNLMHVFSAGNSNGQNCGYGAGNQWGTITGGHKQAKNCITVANLNEDGSLFGTSSRGPAYDGRIKPDIAAFGEGSISTAPNNGYQEFGGTSASAPGIAGVIAQLHQAYRELNNGATAHAGLLKACLLNSANDLGNPGPDFKTGWGQMNAFRALKLLENQSFLEATLTQGQTNSHDITIPVGVEKVNVMLYWSDQEASAFAPKALVNDLDLSIINDNTGENFLPWVLNHFPDSAALAAPAAKGVDHLNNVEQVTIDNPQAGTYTINVEGFEIPFGSHEYILVWNFMMPEIELTFPNGGEAFSPNETIRIHWDGYGQASPFQLFYSINGGDDFTQITTLPGHATYYDWQLPNIISGDVLLKIETTGQMGSSQNQIPFSITPVPQGLKTTQACHDFIRVSWETVDIGTENGTSEYEVFLLGEQYMESIGTTGLNYFDVPTFDQNPTLDHWIAVRTIGPNGIKSERSVAILHNEGLLNCTSKDDIAFVSIDAPDEGFLFGCGTFEIPVEVTFKNNGLLAQDDVVLGYTINGGSPVFENYPFEIAPGAMATYQFLTPLDVVGATGVKLQAFSQLPGDEVFFNDTSTLEFTIALYPGNGKPLPYLEDFEAAVFPPEYFAIDNPDMNKTWEQTIVIGADGNATNCLFMDNYYYSAIGEKDAFLVVPIDLYGTCKPILKFDMAYSQYSDSFADGLVIELSTDCGGTFDQVVFDKHGSVLATVDDQNSHFVPLKEEDWRREEISLENYLGHSIVLKFTNTTGYGNSLFIDNISIEESQSISPAFSVDQSLLCVNQNVQFSNTSEGAIQAVFWDFGEYATPPSSTDPEAVPVVFNQPGQHEIALTVFGNGYSTTIYKTIEVKALPIPFFDISIEESQVSFYNQSQNAETYSWDFGDGQSSSFPNPVHEYQSQGTYLVMLKAGNACGDHSFTSQPIQIIQSDSAVAYMHPKTILSPNPASNGFEVLYEKYTGTKLDISVKDLNGKEQMGKTYPLIGSKGKLSVECPSLKDGFYLVEVSNERWYKVLKLVIKN